MADVEQRAEAEATAKGLSGQARKSYIGGVFNKIRQAHARAIKPGKGKTFLANLNRRNRQLARARYQEALRPHEQAVSELKRQRKQELAQLSYEKPPKVEEPSEYTRGEYRAALARHDYESAMRWGKHISPQAVADAQRLHDEAQRHKRAPKPAPAERQRQRAIAQAIQHGAPDFPPGTLAAAQGKPAKAMPGEAHPRSAARLARAERMLDDLRRDKGRYAGDIGQDERLLIAEIVSAQHGVRGERSATGSVAPDQLRRIERQIAAARNPLDAAAQRKPAATPPPPTAPAAMARLTDDIKPIRHDPSHEINFVAPLDPDKLKYVFSEEQVPKILDRFSAAKLNETVELIERRTGKHYTGSRKSKAALKRWILSNS